MHYRSSWTDVALASAQHKQHKYTRIVNATQAGLIAFRVKREKRKMGEIIIRICQGFYKSLEIRAKSFQSVKHDCCLKEWNEARKRPFHLSFFPSSFPPLASLPPHHSFFHLSGNNYYLK